MNKRLRFIFVLIAFCLILSFGISASGQSLLVDDSDLLSAQEEAALTELLQEARSKTNMDYVIVTMDSLNGRSVKSYASSFYDQYGYGMNSTRDGILLLVAMEEREIWILTNGRTADVITSKKVDEMLDEIAPCLTDGDYYEGFCTFVSSAEYTMFSQPVICETPLSVFPWEQLVLAFVIGALLAFIAVGVMKSKLKSVRSRPSAHGYVRSGSFEVTKSYDRFLYRNVRRIARETSNSNGGSRGGSSRGGGGRSF